MLSDTLRNRADRLAGNALRNEPFSPQECSILAHELLAFADIAAQMENTWFSPEMMEELASSFGDARDAA